MAEKTLQELSLEYRQKYPDEFSPLEWLGQFSERAMKKFLTDALTANKRLKFKTQKGSTRVLVELV